MMYQYYTTNRRAFFTDLLFFIPSALFLFLLAAPFIPPLFSGVNISSQAVRTYTQLPYPRSTQFLNADTHIRIDCRAGWFSRDYLTPHTPSAVAEYYQQHGFHTTGDALTLSRDMVTIHIVSEQVPAHLARTRFSKELWRAPASLPLTRYSVHFTVISDKEVYTSSPCWHD